ncbi:MAG TPA: hypothetical protein VNG91_06495 [Terriglobia bacterium]|nr:hypothetical protein [Terriglobia bacterium]
MLFDSEPPKPRTGIRKYIPLPLLIILIVVGIVIAYFELHNIPEEHAVERFLTTLEKGNYQQAYKLWEPAPSYQFQDFLHDWGPQGDYGKITEYKILDTESKGSDLVIVTVQINNQSPPLDLVVTRKSKGLAYSPF